MQKSSSQNANVVCGMWTLWTLSKLGAFKTEKFYQIRNHLPHLMDEWHQKIVSHEIHVVPFFVEAFRRRFYCITKLSLIFGSRYIKEKRNQTFFNFNLQSNNIHHKKRKQQQKMERKSRDHLQHNTQSSQ